MNKLVMRFLTTIEGKYFTLSVDDIKADDKGPTITQAEVNALMDLVIAKNIFLSTSGDLTGKKDAKIVTTDTNTIKVA
ncbi:DUF2922 domain-containing protein [Clostridium estertheticum]|uniref:DUF2922 domain-containing protein n=1 Tax=Clostridium estertheticum TaxID=238834 RepID=UPI00124D1695|nr:DUF2922 domain-containing protein [Clostridium estertheticum]MBZ9618579.1 DUF2922 domain-containing protein [Clostridium estertheticum subsp. laramiense]WAG76416.1 DUF2922 domain-containing protein [Clostridium estertheticum]